MGLLHRCSLHQSTAAKKSPSFILQKETGYYPAAIISSPPYYFRFNADFALEYKGPSGTVNKQGKGIYEMMLLRGLQTVR